MNDEQRARVLERHEQGVHGRLAAEIQRVCPACEREVSSAAGASREASASQGAAGSGAQ